MQGNQPSVGSNLKTIDVAAQRSCALRNPTSITASPDPALTDGLNYDIPPVNIFNYKEKTESQ